MTRIKGTLTSPARLAAVPLAVAYGAIPLGTAAARLVDGNGAVSPTLPWLLLTGIGLILSLHRPTPEAPPRKGFVYKATLFMLMVIGLFMYSADLMEAQAAVLPYLRESTPLIFLLFCGLWASTCGLPDRGDFQRFGALLGTLCILDLVAEIVLLQAVPTVRLIGNADVLAGLLLVSLCASLRPGDNDGGVPEPDQGQLGWRILIMLGLMACLSRTGLFAAAWVVLCFGRGRLRNRALYSALSGLLIGITFLLPPTASEAVRYTDYWLWVEALRLFATTPATLLTGFPIDASLPVIFPVGMGPVWEAATGSASSIGAFLTQIPSFWLRLTLGWGIGVPIAILTILFILLFRRLTRMGAGLTAALFAQGMSTPLLFEPAMATAIGLGFILALSSPATRPNVKSADPVTPPAAPASGMLPDPTQEWDLRPL